MRILPVTTSIIGQGVEARTILLNTLWPEFFSDFGVAGELQRTDMALTCNPNPPTCCGAPSNRAFFLRLQCSSCCIVPCENPNIVTCIPEVVGNRQLSLPPPPIIVGEIADITGEALAAPAAL